MRTPLEPAEALRGVLASNVTWDVMTAAACGADRSR
ncbi:hypothetical protein STVIR_0038 [Streptomyces viridochromogenes Tue57]|uniref:Uncharacterized protein n=1 Tax=Streptomyces viridochromogenes Tue57 TaxID=1160705 RepID=L8PSJ2_STRVR|nr:hypothetical protein STVIR_0038 [Streptomyces viridochromogenes Tue57]